MIAGSAEAGSTVSIRVDGAEVATAEADVRGSFVALFTLLPSQAGRVVTLVARSGSGREVGSLASVLLTPTTAPEVAPDVSTAEVVQPDAPDTADADLPGGGAQTAGGEPAPPAAAPTAVLLTDAGAQVLEPAALEPAFARNVTIDAISYSTEGDVQLSGRGGAGATVRLYLDNQPMLETTIAPDGRWAGTLPAIAAGVYTLRADQLAADGKVRSRYETPFQREAPELLRAAAQTGDAPGAAQQITVQPGFTLWRIARESYGQGVMYVRVYEANRNQIRDPDLIYPGQVFTVPGNE